MERIIEAASRTIDRHCGRRFYGLPETRYYTAQDGFELQIDDLTSITALKTDEDGDGTFETTWAAGDYALWPYNAILDGKPYMMIETTSAGANTFPVGIARSVLVQGTFGYIVSTNANNCPDAIHDACLMWANRLYARHNTPLGIAGAPQLGEQRTIIPRASLDPDVADMIAGYRRL